MESNDINKLYCRICSGTDSVMTTIFAEHEYANNIVCEMLAECGGLAVEKNDGFSNYLCKLCSAELLIAADFRKKCIKLQKKLKLNLEGESLVATCRNDESTSEEEINIEELLGLITEIKYGTSNLQVEAQQVESQHIETQQVASQQVEPQQVESHEEEVDISSSNCLATIDLTNDLQNDLVNLEFNLNSTSTEYGNQSPAHIVLKYSNEARGTGFDPNNFIEFDADNVIVEEMEVDKIVKHEQQDLEYEHDENDNPIDILPTEYTAIEYNCDVCGAHFVQSITLLRHLLNEHHSNKYYSCKNCKHCFANFDNYDAHTANCQFDASQIVKEEKNRNCVCTYCGKKFNGTYALVLHERTHTGEKPFHCTLCNKSFRSTGGLSNHEQRHNGQSPKYDCHICGKSFTEKGNLRVHIRSHTGEKKHECRVCHKRFTRVYLLTLHMRTHTGEQPYPCGKCSRAFKQKCDLQKHMNIHSGDRRYTCSWCGQGFMHRSRLDRHVKSHENNAMECSDSITKSDKLSEIISELELDEFSVCDEEPPVNYNSNELNEFNRIMELIE